MSCRCHLVRETGFQGSPRFDNSQNDSQGSQKHGTYKNKCPGLDDQAWNALSSLREKTCRMFSSGSEGTGTDVSARSPYGSEPSPECGNIVRKANDLIDYAPESEFLKKMKLQCQYLQCNQANIFSALDEGIEDDCFEYHEQNAQPAQTGGPMYSTPTNQTYPKYNYDECPQMDYSDYNDMDLYPFSFELESNAQNLQSQPAVEVSYLEPQIQKNEEGKSEHVSRSRKPVKCRGRRKRKSANAGKCESENQFEPTLKKPHENSCDRCWRYASPSRSPVNKPDQKYDPNFRRGHSRTDFESGDANLKGRESYTSPCLDCETDTKDPTPPRFPAQNASERFPSPPKPATAPEQYQQPLIAQYYPSPRDVQNYPRVQSTSPPRNMQNYPVGIPTTTAMPQTCAGGLSSTFTVTKPTRSAAVPNYQTDPPSWISTMPRPPCVRSSSPLGTAPPTISPNYSSPQSPSPPKTMQNYSGEQWSMQQSSGGQSSSLSNTMPTPPSVQSPSRSGQNYSTLQGSSPGRNVQNYSSGQSSFVPGPIPRPSTAPRPRQSCPCSQPPPPSPSMRPPSAPSPRQTSPNTVGRKFVQFDQPPLRATDRSVQNFNQPCPPCQQGMIYTASGRKERPKSAVPDMGPTEVNRCYNGAQELDVTDYKIFTPRTKDQSGNSIETCDPNDLSESQYVYSINDETYDVPVIPVPVSQSPGNTSSRQSPNRRQSPENTSTRQSPAPRQSPGGLETIPEGKRSSTKSPKSNSPKNTSKHTSPKSGSPNRGKTCTPKSKSPEKTGSKKGKTKSPSPKPGTSKEASKSPKRSPQKPSPGKSSSAPGEKQHPTTERSPIAGPSKEYHSGAKTDAAKAKDWYIDSDHPLRECTCFPRVPVFKNDPDNYNGERIFCCHCDWKKTGNNPRSGSGEKQTMSGSCNCSSLRTPQPPKAFDGISFPCPYRDVANSRNNVTVPPEAGSELQRSTRSSPQQQQRSTRSSPQQQQGGTKPSPQQQQQQQQQSGTKPSPQQQQQGGTKPSPQQQQQNLSSNPAECPPRKYVVYYMTQCREKKKNNDDVEVLVEEFSRCPKESDSRTNDITEKMKRIMDCPSDSMALRFQKGVSESTRTPPSSRILYF